MFKRLSFFLQVRKSIPFLFDFFGSHEVSWIKKSLVLGIGAAYALVPLDAIPDFIPVLGQLDDLAVLGLILNYVAAKAPKSLKEKYGVR